MGVEPVLRHAGQLVGADGDRPHALTDVLGELLTGRELGTGQFAKPLAVGVGLVDAGTTEVAPGEVEQALRVGVGARVGLVEHREQLAVEPELGGVVVDPLGRLVGRLAHTGVGVHLREQRRRCGGVAELDLHGVPGGEHVGDGARLQSVDQRAGVVERAVAAVGQPVEGVVDGQFESGDRHGATLTVGPDRMPGASGYFHTAGGV